MSQMKRFAEQVSVEMGLGGEINDEVLAEAQRRLDAASKQSENLTRQADSEYREEQLRRQAGSLVNYDGYPCEHGEYCSDCGEHIMDCCCD